MNASPGPQPIQCEISPGFDEWLAQSGGAIAATTYQAGKVAVIGWHAGQVTLLMRQFDKPLGMAFRDAEMILATRHRLWHLADAPRLAHEYLEQQPGRYDALFLPRAAYFTGDVNIHEVAFTGDDVVMVNTRFSCLARPSLSHNFEPVWRPPFISELTPDDRCHLNGLAIRESQPAFVTAHGTSDEAGGWRDRKADGGVVIDVQQDVVLSEGWAMPHSPRWHDGRLWVLNSGTGELCTVDLDSGQRTTIIQLPGYLRGLDFVGDVALIGLSQIRERHIFGDLPVQASHDRLVCGIAVVDLHAGKERGRLEFTTGCQEIFALQFLPGKRQPMILNLHRDLVWESISAPDFGYWLRPSKELPLDPDQGGS